MISNRLAAFLSVALTASSLLGCDEYDPPPEAKLVQPTVGFWTSETPIEVRFTEAIDPSSLVITIWPSEVDIEGNFRPDVRPVIEACSLATSPCNGLILELNESATMATLTQNEVFAEREGTPMTMEIHAGLKDTKGRTRKVPTFYDFQINPQCGNQPVDIELETGVISLAADLQVLPIWLQMFLDFAVDKDTGRFTVAGTFARVNPGEATNENDPALMFADISDVGWAVTFTGCLVKQPDGSYFLQSDPFDVSITVLNIIPVTLTGFQVQGTIKPGGAPDGRDFASGTLSTSGGSFGDPPNAVEPITTAWDGFGLTADQIVPGLPRVCEESPCAELDAAGGDCQIPDGFDPGPVCP
ncbi:MAG TPA: hypothetical protein PK095_11740 [Myxococcota bacterium]|nr:hypothetical protein [Myxococcota bacterium]